MSKKRKILLEKAINFLHIINNQRQKLRLLSFILLVAFWLVSCQDDNVVFEENQSIKDGIWQRHEPISLEFEVQDTSKKYDLYYNIRNELSYPHYNLYVTYYLHYPDGKKIDSLLMNILLFDKNTGEPYGKGTGGIRTHQLPAFLGFKFSQKGKYKYTFKQYMRLNPLKGILSMGLRVEEAEAASEHQDTPKTAK